jgi:shikimate kinase/3-dehydroquinate synthase
VADLAHLETLPARERAAGFAEIVKVALSSDASLFERVEREAPSLVRGDLTSIEPIVRAAIEAKIRVVRDDERESGSRALLNLGHTVGHALEAHGGFSRWLHGEAVALGLVAELRATSRLGWTRPGIADRVADVLSVLGLPFHVNRADVAAAWPYVAADKKRSGAGVRLPVVETPGASRLELVRLEALREAVLAT